MAIAPEKVTEAAADEVRLPTRRWTTADYFRAVELGVFRPDEQLELIKGEIISRMSPTNAPHTTAVLMVAEELTRAFGVGHHVRPEQPLLIGGDSVPEPDVVVVAGSLRDYASRHPTNQEVLLVVEVSDTTLAQDRRVKAALYAEAGIAEYWIINLPERRLEVHREPAALGQGFTYRTLTLYGEQDRVTPLAAPQAILAVADLLP